MAKENTKLGEWNKKGWVEVDGKLVRSDSLVVSRVDKINVGIPMFNEAPNGNQNTVIDGIPPDFNACYTVRFKPMSVNEAWKGKRYRSDKYNAYKLAVGCLLPKHVIIPNGLLKVYYEFGLSSNGGDWDNPVKPIQDILQQTYGFNDSRIVEAHVKKVIVAKGSEYIRFKIEQL